VLPFFYARKIFPENSAYSCGSGLARESGVSVNIDFERQSAFASKPAPSMTMSVIERMTLLDSILEELANDTLSIHQAIRRLRVEVTGLNQAQFARMCKISVRALVQMEHGEGNQTLKSLSKVFSLFGMRVGILKLRRDIG